MLGALRETCAQWAAVEVPGKAPALIDARWNVGLPPAPPAPVTSAEAEDAAVSRSSQRAPADAAGHFCYYCAALAKPVSARAPHTLLHPALPAQPLAFGFERAIAHKRSVGPSHRCARRTRCCCAPSV